MKPASLFSASFKEKPCKSKTLSIANLPVFILLSLFFSTVLNIDCSLFTTFSLDRTLDIVGFDKTVDEFLTVIESENLFLPKTVSLAILSFFFLYCSDLQILAKECHYQLRVWTFFLSLSGLKQPNRTTLGEVSCEYPRIFLLFYLIGMTLND